MDKKYLFIYISIEMSSSDSIQTKDDFKKMFGRSPIKKGIYKFKKKIII